MREGYVRALFVFIENEETRLAERRAARARRAARRAAAPHATQATPQTAQATPQTAQAAPQTDAGSGSDLDGSDGDDLDQVTVSTKMGHRLMHWYHLMLEFLYYHYII